MYLYGISGLNATNGISGLNFLFSPLSARALLTLSFGSLFMNHLTNESIWKEGLDFTSDASGFCLPAFAVRKITK